MIAVSWGTMPWILTRGKSDGTVGAVVGMSCMVSFPVESSSTPAVKCAGRFSVALVLLMLCTVTEMSVLCEVSWAPEGGPT